jgi:hypothetical protein
MATVHSATLNDEMARARLLRDIQRAPIKDERGRFMLVTVQRLVDGRSLEQNRLWQAWAKILADHAGCEHGYMKREIQRELLGEVENVNPFTGEVMREPVGTSGLDKAEFAQFLNRVEVLAWEHFTVSLPQPNDPRAWAAFKRTQRAA